MHKWEFIFLKNRCCRKIKINALSNIFKIYILLYTGTGVCIFFQPSSNKAKLLWGSYVNIALTVPGTGTGDNNAKFKNTPFLINLV
jgi:hypothetical protein